MSLVWAFDLEMNQPSGLIIELGGCIGDISTGEIVDTFSHLTQIPELLNPYITQLTTITSDMMQQSIPLDEAYADMKKRLDKYHPLHMPITWGSGDLWALKKQVSKPIKIRTELNLKCVHQALQLSKGLPIKGGLATAMAGYGLQFTGVPHRAMDDAINTFLLASKINQGLKGTLF